MFCVWQSLSLTFFLFFDLDLDPGRPAALVPAELATVLTAVPEAELLPPVPPWEVDRGPPGKVGTADTGVEGVEGGLWRTHKRKTGISETGRVRWGRDIKQR